MKTYRNPQGLPFTLAITATEAAALGITAADIAAGEKRLEIETAGPWQIVRRVSGLTHTTERDDSGRIIARTFHGTRSMSQPRSTGYTLEGHVSIQGCKTRAFTSSQMFDIDGTLVDVGTLYACQ